MKLSFERLTAAVTFEGKRRYFYTQTYSGHEVWGATAAMLLNLGERIL